MPDGATTLRQWVCFPNATDGRGQVASSQTYRLVVETAKGRLVIATVALRTAPDIALAANLARLVDERPFELASRESGQRGLITRVSTDERHYEITVDNLHSRAMEITILDRVPVAEDERITVQQLDDTTEPTETDVDGTRGVLAWTYDYEPGETREIRNGYLVTWPTDLDITGLD